MSVCTAFKIDRCENLIFISDKLLDDKLGVAKIHYYSDLEFEISSSSFLKVGSISDRVGFRIRLTIIPV